MNILIPKAQQQFMWFFLLLARKCEEGLAQTLCLYTIFPKMLLGKAGFLLKTTGFRMLFGYLKILVMAIIGGLRNL